jgi:hypothetical protein
MRPLVLTVALLPLVLTALACGLGGESCEHAGARRARALASCRAELERSIADWHARYERQSRAGVQDTAAVTRSVLERYERDLGAVARAEEALARGDEEAADQAIEDIPSPMGARASYDELQDANSSMRYCNP